MSFPRSTKPRSSSPPRRAAPASSRSSTLFERLSLLIQEARWLVLGALSLYVGLVLLGYDHADPGWSHSAEVVRISNPGGRFGAWLADLLFSLFGFSAWWWVAFLGYGLVWGFRRLRLDAAPERRSFLWMLIGFGIVLLSSSALEALRFHSHELIAPLRPGGLIGVELARLLNEMLGFTGSTLLLLPVLAVGFSLLTGMSWLWLAEQVGAALEAVWVSLFGSREERRAALAERQAAASAAAATVQTAPAPTGRIEPVPAPAPVPVAPAPTPVPAPAPVQRQEPMLAAEPPAPVAAPMYAGGAGGPRRASMRAEPVAHEPQEPFYADDPPPLVRTRTVTPVREPVPTPVAVEPREPLIAAFDDDALLLTQRVEEGEDEAVEDAFIASPAPVVPAPVAPPPPPEPTPAPVRVQAPPPVMPAPASSPAGEDEFSDEAFIFAEPAPARASAPRPPAPALPVAPPRTPAEVRQAAEPLLRENHAAEFGDEFAQALEEDFDDEDFAMASPAPAVLPPVVPAPVASVEPPRIVRAASLDEELAAGGGGGRPHEVNLLPPLDLLDQPADDTVPPSSELLESTANLIETRLRDFGVEVKVVAAYPGPVVTRYEIEPATGVKGSQVVNLGKDLARALSLVSLRVVETVPGKSYMALELPNSKRQMVRLLEVIGSQAWANMTSPLTVVLGKDIGGQPAVADLAKMPHLLVAGTTGSGKSVGINAMILSLIYKSDPSRVRLIMIDPKMLELSIYEGIPHLLAPVVTDMKHAANALNWCVAEMDKRFKLMAAVGVRNLAGFNKVVTEARQRGEPLTNPFSITPDNPEPLQTLPYIVVIVDELADLMMVVGKKVEELIARLAQKARAAGIHLILATQRPSVDVITGLIKANVPTRIAFQVSSKIDSRTILDQMGAENLLGMGDMLYLAPGTGLPVRAHGAFVSDDEVHRVVDHLKRLAPPDYVEDILTQPEEEGGGVEGEADDESDGESDALYDQAVEVVITNRRASISLVQRHLRIGYNRSARLLDQMERAGLVSSMGSNGSREVLVPARETE